MNSDNVSDNIMKKWQIRIFVACFIAYTAAYICRVNVSVAIPGIQKALNLNSTKVGLIGTSFFWVYAIGQLVNGYIGDKVSSRLFIFTGLTMSALLNVAFGFSSALPVMILVWGTNGIFQSMLWGPIVKTLSGWFPSKSKNLMAFGMSGTMILGYLVAWGMSGFILDRFKWNWVFWLPAAIVIVLAFVWLFMVRNKPSDIGLDSVHEAGTPEEGTELIQAQVDKQYSKNTTILKLITETDLLFIGLTGITQGIIKDGLSLWSPKLLMDTQNLSLNSTIGMILVIPFVNFVGIIFAGWLNKLLKFREKLTIFLLMMGSIFTSLGLMFFIHISVFLSILLLACASACMFGANPMMTTLIPLNYKRYNRVSAVAGFIDFCIYIGSGLAGVFTGAIVDNFGWNGVFVMWCVISALGAASMGLCLFKETKKTITNTLHIHS